MNFSLACVITVFTLAVVMGVLANYCRSELISWFILMMFMIKIHSIIHFSEVGDVHYREFNYYLYSIVKVSPLISSNHFLKLMKTIYFL